MTFHKQISVDDVFDPQRDLRAVRAFLEQHGSALPRTAHALGGGSASGRVFGLIDSVRVARRLTWLHRFQLKALHRLLRLEEVGHPDRLETALFAAIDPASPVVEEICVLADSLSTLLIEIGADDPEPAFDSDAVFRLFT